MQAVFQRLKAILERHAADLACVRDRPDDYYLDTTHVMSNGKPLFFGSVRTTKRYVGYHLMPVYVFPELLEGLSPELRRRMHGKSCFNFKAVDDAMLEELARLTEAGYRKYREAGYV